MKKRLISLLLTVVMLMSLCTALGTSASAAANVTTVTIASGDTIVGLCQKLGVDFYTYKNLIMNLNGFTSESQLSKVSVGQQIVLPSSAAAAATLSGSSATAATLASATTTAATPVAAAATGTLTTGQATAIPAGDSVAYYLVSYTIQSGETIQGIYANWGLSYKTYDTQIKKLNNITSYSSISAGKTLLLPTTNPGVASNTYYTVMAHAMRSGDSAYDIITGSYGMNFSTNQKLILALNNTTDLSYIKAGTNLYIPVSGVVSATTTVSTAAASYTAAAATTTTATVSAGGVYNLVAQTAVNGSFDMQIDDCSVTTAQAGKTVKVVAAPNYGYALDTIKVIKVGDASTTVGVSNGYFTMPSFSVIVSVTFKTAKAFDVDVEKASNGSVTAMVGSTKVSEAYVGNTVTVKTIPDTGFMLDYVRVTYNNGKDSVAVYNNTFTMPEHDVTVSAMFVKDPDYDPTLGHQIYTSVENGIIETSVGTKETGFANAGDRVTVDVIPNDNYITESVTVYYDNFKKTAEIDKGSFTMPDAPVTVVAVIKPSSTAKFAITKVDTTNGSFATLVDGTQVTEAKIGEKVTVYGVPKSDAYWYIVTVYKTGDTTVVVPVTRNDDGTSYFEMPEYPVSVHCKFYLYHKVILDASNGVRGNFAVYAGNAQVSQCASGVELNVAIWGAKSGYTASNVILTYKDGSSYTLTGTSFIMPDCDVKVKVNFTEKQTIVAHAATMNGKYGAYGNTYTVGSKTLNGNKAATATLTAGVDQNVVVYTTPAIGYEVLEGNVTITYTDTAGTVHSNVPVAINPVTGKFQFQMPELKDGTSLDLYVNFTEVATYAITLDYKSGYAAGDDNLDHKKGTFNVSMLSHSAYVDHAKEGQKAQIHCFPATGYAVKSADIKVINVSTGAELEINRNDYTFVMPAAPVQVIVPFYETSHYIQLLRANDGVDGKPKGTLSVIVGGIEYTDWDLVGEGYNNIRKKFPIGTLVTVVNRSRTGFVLDSENPIVINKIVDGSPVNYKTIDGDHFSFEMPNADVVISAQYIDDMVAINAVESQHGSYKVPAQVAWNGSFSVTEIVPEEGYELDRILISYVDHDGESHSREELVGTTVDLSDNTGMLGSNITVEVLFKAAINPMTIKYIFDDTYDENSNYKVDLIVDGKTVEGITRSYDFSDYTDHLYKFNNDDPADLLTGKGIQTGKTVVIKRNESKLDKNFEIINIWVMFNNGGAEPVAIKPEFSNNQYYFTMPYVGTGSSEDLTLYIEYAKYVADAYNLSAYKADGDGEVSSWQFTVDSTATNRATVTASSIQLDIIVPDECEITDPTVLVRYTDSDGVAHPTAEEYTAAVDGGVSFELVNDVGDPNRWSIVFDNTDGLYPEIKSMPLNKAVTVEYKVEKCAYAAPDNDDDGYCNLVYTVDGEEQVSPADIKWGKTVALRAVPVNDGEAVDTVKVYRISDAKGDALAEPEEISVSKSAAGTFQFVMPKGEIMVVVTMKTVATTVKFDNSTCPDTHMIIAANGSKYTDQVAVAEGTTVKFCFDAPLNYMVDYDTVADTSDPSLIGAPDANGIFTFTMPADNVVITAVVAEKEFTMRVVPDTAGITGLNYTVAADGAALTADTDDDTGRTFSGIKYGVTYSVTAPKEDGEIKYKVSKASITYRDTNNNEIVESAAIDENGVASFKLGYVPRNDAEIVVKPTFVENSKATYTIKWDPTIGTEYELTYSTEDSEEVRAGKVVIIGMSIKYYKYLSEEAMPDFLKLSYTVGGEKQYINLTKVIIGSVDGYDQRYKCYSYFVMPSADVTVEVDPSALTDRTKVKVTGSSVYYYDSAEDDCYTLSKYVMGNSYYVDVNDTDAEAGYTYNVTLKYVSDTGEDIIYTQYALSPVFIDGGYYVEFALERGNEPAGANTHLIPLGAVFTVSVDGVAP